MNIYLFIIYIQKPVVTIFEHYWLITRSLWRHHCQYNISANSLEIWSITAGHRGLYSRRPLLFVCFVVWCLDLLFHSFWLTVFIVSDNDMNNWFEWMISLVNMDIQFGSMILSGHQFSQYTTIERTDI